jgi:uncharacterized protein YlzI (FlbEa/FlbD family)
VFISVTDQNNRAVFVNVDNILKVEQRENGTCAILMVGESVYTPQSAQSVMDQIHEKER